MALLAALCLFLHLPEGFRNRHLRAHVAALLGENLQQYNRRQDELRFAKTAPQRAHLSQSGHYQLASNISY